VADTVMTPIGRLCFPALFEPRAQAQGGDPRYSCVLVFDENAVKTPAYQALRKAVQEAIAEKWGATKAADAAFIRTLRLPFRDPNEKDYSGFEGEVYISPWQKGTNKAPDVIDKHGNDIEVPDDVFAGQYARATVRAFAYDTNGNKGVSFGLEHVQIVKADAERIDGRRSGQQAFAGAGDDPDAELKAMGIDPDESAPAGSGGGSSPAADDDLPF